MSIKKIRAVERALLVIETLSQSGSLSLIQLRQKTGLDNATLLRILTTLTDRGWVRPLIVEKKYTLSHSLGARLDTSAWAHPISELAAPVMLALKSNPFHLPSDLCAIVGEGIVEIVESTRQRGPLAPTRTGLGLRPSLFKSAHGRAILAAMPDSVRIQHLEKFLNRASKEDKLWYQQGLFEEEIARTQDRGYGIREPHYWEPPFDEDPAFCAIAVCIQNEAGIYGSISLIWLEQELSLEQILKAELAQKLTLAAQEIADALARNNIPAPIAM